MTALPLVDAAGDAAPGGVHATAEEYAAFLRGYATDPDTARNQLGFRARFVRHYPDLRDWFRAPLAHRVGRVRGEGTTAATMTCYACWQAQRYLLFLAARGRARLDWEWLLAEARLDTKRLLAAAGVDLGVEGLVADAVRLGYARRKAEEYLQWAVSRLFLRTGDPDPRHITEARLDAFADAVHRFADRPDVDRLFGSRDAFLRRQYTHALLVLRVVLYHRGQLPHEPRRAVRPRPAPPSHAPAMDAVVARFLDARRLSMAPATVKREREGLRRFQRWLAGAHPEVRSFAEVDRDHVLAFARALDAMTSPRTGRPLAALSKRAALAPLSVFFAETAAWGWRDVPGRPLLAPGDLARVPVPLPRFIPDDELPRLMQAVEALPCPYQRAALLVARWSGARKSEIRRLEVDCLDHYPDADRTPRLRIPAGKNYRERLVPLTEPAARAVRELQTLARGGRGFTDEKTGRETYYLFVKRGRRLSLAHLFDDALRAACRAAGLLRPDGSPAVSAHRFRHTVGTTLGNKGARLHTIMRVLGHTSPAMAMVYTSIGDPEVLRDYLAVLGPGVALAGPLAPTLRAGDLPTSTVEWLKSNFFKTELELGHCLRLPEEGPCECDLALTCAKFVTTRAYAPRLRRRRGLELELAEDAAARGWSREVERHRCTAERIERYLADLGEPLEGPVASE